MSDSFFGFDTSHMSDDDLGPPDLDDDRYNSETFGADAGEWEEDDHEKISAYLERERSALHQLGNGGARLPSAELPTASDIERGLSKLVTDDDLDDPCIMSVRRSSRAAAAGVAIPQPQFGRPRSPPISSLLESDISGSPSANSIWSTTPTRTPTAFDDPAIMSLGRPRAPPPPSRLPLPAGGKVRTVEELEQDLLARSPARLVSGGPPPGFGRPPPMDFSRPPPMRLPPPPGGLGGPGSPRGVGGAGERFRMPNTQLPPPSVTSILPPQLMNKDRGGGGGRGFPSGRGQHHHQQRQSQPQWRQEQERRRQDPYAGLMTSRERQWLLNIQRMQIKGNTDFYFQHFNTRKLSRGRRDSSGGHRDQHKDKDDKHTDHRLYKPPEMENSLGKLQVASVTAPRKIIDLGVISQESADGSRDHKEAKRDRQTLLLIEQLFQHVMQLEDADRRAAGELPPEPEPEPPEPRPSPEQVRAAATARIWGALGREQLLVHVLSIRKGKGLVLRCLPVLDSQQYYQIAVTLLKNLAVILHRDRADNMLHRFYVCLQMVVSNSDLAQITDLTAALTASTDLDSASPGKTPLQLIAGSPFGVSVTILLLLRGDQLCQQPASGDSADRWRPLAAALVRCLSALPSLAPPLEPVPGALLAKHVPDPSLVARLAGEAADS